MTRLRRAARLQRHVWPVQNKHLHRGRSSARGTEATTEGGEEVGGLHTSVEAGELVATRTRSSKGGPCGCELQEGTMTNASTLEVMSLQLLRVVERAQGLVATSRIHGGAGWWKSPCPDLERARGR